MLRLFKSILTILLLMPFTPAMSQVEISTNNIYGYKEGMALFYDVFQHPETTNGAGIIYIWSNSWVSDHLPPEYAATLLNNIIEPGYTVFLVYHGSSPLFKVTDAYSDVSLAAKHIFDNASKWGVDTNKIGVVGGSAGGQLALMLAYDSNSETYNGKRFSAAVAYYPPVDIRQIIRPLDKHDSGLNISIEEAATVSPILFVTQDDPPTLLVHGDMDELVPISNSQELKSALDSASVVSEFVVLEGGDHGFRNNSEHMPMAAQLRKEWFDRHILKQR